MHQAEFEQHVGTENISASIADALERAKALYPLVQQSRTPSAWGRRRTDVKQFDDVPQTT